MNKIIGFVVNSTAIKYINLVGFIRYFDIQKQPLPVTIVFRGFMVKSRQLNILEITLGNSLECYS